MREKLIELLWANYNDHPSAFSGLTDEFEHEADYLISHGVVVREKGEWKLFHSMVGDVWLCSVCDKANPHQRDYCPNCGADMRGE